MVACLAVSGAEDLLSRLIGMRLLWLLLRQGYSMGLILEARGSTLHQCFLTGDAEPVSFYCFTFFNSQTSWEVCFYGFCFVGHLAEMRSLISYDDDNLESNTEAEDTSADADDMCFMSLMIILSLYYLLSFEPQVHVGYYES